MKKVCNGCGEERDDEQDFNWKYKDRGIRHSRCKYCMSQASRLHYQNNKSSYLTRIHRRDKEELLINRQKLYSYLMEHPCVDCGKTDVRVLDLDHVQGVKRASIVRMMSTGCSWRTIEAEMEKCEVRCANCHRIRTGQTGNSWRNFFVTLEERLQSEIMRGSDALRTMKMRIENMRNLHTYLSCHPCVDCAVGDIRILEFDHVQGVKYEEVGRLLTNAASWPRIEAEIAKCEVRCANCHRIKTIERGQWWRAALVEQEKLVY
jgi:hypothetical protein